jgi:Fe-S-cluster containining protein
LRENPLAETREDILVSLVHISRNAFVPAETTIHKKMAPFTCDHCGKCCISLGPAIVVERQLNDRDYYCRSTIDNAVFTAQVEKVFQDEIADEFLAAEYGQDTGGERPCRFLRWDPQTAVSRCAIYATRPEVCRNFRCYHWIIRDRDGIFCGRVIGKNTLRTDNPVLKTIWESEIAAKPCGETSARAPDVAAILARYGYTLENIE